MSFLRRFGTSTWSFLRGPDGEKGADLGAEFTHKSPPTGGMGKTTVRWDGNGEGVAAGSDPNGFLKVNGRKIMKAWL
jgi:hypothetical protein